MNRAIDQSVACGPIAIVDSGLGGLPYLQAIRQLLPMADFVYLADSQGFPYGTKSETAITTLFSRAVERLLKRINPSLFVVACNTASIVALEYLRQHYPYQFVGVVPAIKPAAAQSQRKSIALLATRRTIRGSYLDDLIARFAADCRVTRIVATQLISLIEHDPFLSDAAAFDGCLDDIHRQVLAGQADVLVLGCTHFLHIEAQFLAKMAGIPVLDSRQGVARQVKRGLESVGVLAANRSSGDSRPVLDGSEPDNRFGLNQLFLTAPVANQELYRRLAGDYGLGFGGVLDD